MLTEQEITSRVGKEIFEKARKCRELPDNLKDRIVNDLVAEGMNTVEEQIQKTGIPMMCHPLEFEGSLIFHLKMAAHVFMTTEEMNRYTTSRDEHGLPIESR